MGHREGTHAEESRNFFYSHILPTRRCKQAQLFHRFAASRSHNSCWLLSVRHISYSYTYIFYFQFAQITRRKHSPGFTRLLGTRYAAIHHPVTPTRQVPTRISKSSILFSALNSNLTHKGLYTFFQLAPTHHLRLHLCRPQLVIQELSTWTIAEPIAGGCSPIGHVKPGNGVSSLSRFAQSTIIMSDLYPRLCSRRHCQYSTISTIGHRGHVARLMKTYFS